MKKIVWFCLLLISFSFKLNILSQEVEKSELHQKLLTLPDISVKIIKCDSNFSEAFEIFLIQPVDHLNPNNGPKFKQRIYLRHNDFTKPMVMNNEGYATNSSRRTELAKILHCNEMFVEHRYFGESKPDSTLGWKYLTTAQSAADHKRVVDLFSKIYTGKWISTGISKGGQTSIFFKYYYPDAVDVWVPYVAPLNLEQEDKRIFDFLNNVGTKKCRDKIKAFQRAVLKNRNSILPMLEKHMNEKNYKFTLGLNKTLEYAVFEYSFAFWQWGNSSCDEIPDPSDPPDSLFKHLYTASSFDYFDSTKSSYYLPFYYQAYTEIGYYGYDVKEFSDLLVAVKDSVASSIFFAPKNVSLEFDSDLMLNVRDFIMENGNDMLFIYGENDTWSASAVEMGQNTNALKMVKEGGSHRTRIHSFEGAEKEKIYSTLEKWLDVVIDR
jgi:hypothetical protein